MTWKASRLKYYLPDILSMVAMTFGEVLHRKAAAVCFLV